MSEGVPWCDDLRRATRTRLLTYRVQRGGTVYVDVMTCDGQHPLDERVLDVSVIAPQGASVAFFIDEGQLCLFAAEVLALLALETGQEIGDVIEERRAAHSQASADQ